jgi:hypothetical protein
MAGAAGFTKGYVSALNWEIVAYLFRSIEGSPFGYDPPPRSYRAPPSRISTKNKKTKYDSDPSKIFFCII